MIQSLKDGDRVIFADHREADRIKGLCMKRGINVSCQVLPPNNVTEWQRLGRSSGRTFFDHSWIELRYELAIQYTEKEIDMLSRELSDGQPIDRLPVLLRGVTP